MAPDHGRPRPGQAARGAVPCGRRRPYPASALYSLTVVPSDRVPTMGVDRHWRCYVSPSFVAATSVTELEGVWIHEVAHLLRNHHGRADLPGSKRSTFLGTDPVRHAITR
ncbi:hypothetical protein [Actinomadura sp. NAK00032]|uniref:DUF2201 family putative metallopeptidase n=1 Tax=Actinomadura sp. NAK00032 TaxID=2742128 RepID=UPI0020C80CD7|nr:hypothetical protein [Actinomadura sp. NAK00032]